METPNNRAGQVTEFIMQDVIAKFPEGLAPWQYNRIYEALYHRLESELPQGDRIDGVGRIALERSRQIQAEGWTAAHDDDHTTGDLALAGACYAVMAKGLQNGLSFDQASEVAFGADDENWPWGEGWRKPAKDPIRNLEKAGALIAAEIDRLRRKSS